MTKETVSIEGIESVLQAYFQTVEYLPTEVKDRAVLMSQDLGRLIAEHIRAVHGVDVNWSDGSYRPGGVLPLGFKLNDNLSSTP